MFSGDGSGIKMAASAARAVSASKFQSGRPGGKSRRAGRGGARPGAHRPFLRGRACAESPRSHRYSVSPRCSPAQRESANGYVTVILPEFVPRRMWHHLLHNQTSFFLKAALHFRRGIVVTSVPQHLRR